MLFFFLVLLKDIWIGYKYNELVLAFDVFKGRGKHKVVSGILSPVSISPGINFPPV